MLQPSRLPPEQPSDRRPKKYDGDDLGQTQALLVGHTNKVLADYSWAIELDGVAFWQVANALLNVIFASADKANPKVIEKWLPMGKSTIYNRRKKGNESAMFLDDLADIKDTVKRTAALVEDLHWAEQQRRAEPDIDYVEDDHPLE